MYIGPGFGHCPLPRWTSRVAPDQLRESSPCLQIDLDLYSTAKTRTVCFIPGNGSAYVSS